MPEPREFGVLRKNNAALASPLLLLFAFVKEVGDLLKRGLD